MVLDVLGTLVDQTGSLRRMVADVIDDDRAVPEVVDRWLEHVAEQERAVVDGRRAFTPSHVLDAEALDRLVDEGRLPRDAATVLADASQRLSPWPDARAGLDLLAGTTVTAGLSNAGRRVLARLSHHTGLRWHQVLSAEDAGTYKPARGIYELAIAALAGPAGPPWMVAAHTWDLRAAADAGMRTAYVPRPGGDAPAPGDSVDLVATSLADLHRKLAASWPEG